MEATEKGKELIHRVESNILTHVGAFTENISELIAVVEKHQTTINMKEKYIQGLHNYKRRLVRSD